MIRVSSDTMTAEFKRILLDKGFSSDDSHQAALLFTENSLDGIYSHGVNRFPRVVEYIEKGYIKPGARAVKVAGSHALEQWDGRSGLGTLNAKICMDRAIELARKHGIGCVSVRNNNHWMRGGAYGWQAARAGFIGICWTNTQPNMPAWGAVDRRIGNNPLIIAIPRAKGHVVVDAAMSQFSYGKIEEYRMQGRDLPVPGGYDSDGNISVDPTEIEKTWRVLPIGYWKGSGFALALDLIAGALSGGNTTSEIGKLGDDEYGLSQVIIAIDPYRHENKRTVDSMLDASINDLHLSTPVNPDAGVIYPGEDIERTREDNIKNGIPVIEEVWRSIIRM